MGTDYDECALDAHLCDSNAQCSDTDGSYSCSCHVGFSGTGRTCCTYVDMTEVLREFLILCSP